jgi:uncharacterized protein YcaQ
MVLPLLPNASARRLFLDRHALAEAPAGPCRGASLDVLVDRLGFVQVDSINTVARAHDLILWSRRPSYRPAALARGIERHRTLWEHWTHDASVLPVTVWRYWQHRFNRNQERLKARWRTWFREGWEDQLDKILDRIARDGPVTAADMGDGEPRGKGAGWWDWHPSKTALEWLWQTGRLAITRREGFRKVYDLTEQVIPAAQRTPCPDPAAVVDWACRAALDRLGFATSGELAAFWELVTPADAKAWVRDALARGEIVALEVEGADGARSKAVARPDVLDAAAAAPAPPDRLRILSPFDPALRDRDRAEALFGFFYRIEVFVPEAKRQFGYYVFPVLAGDRLIGRLDAKAFRDEAVLRVRAFWPEARVRMGKGRLARLEAELDRLARFAGCDRVDYLADWLRPPAG